VKKQGILENQVKTVYLSIGSNKGDRLKNINMTKYKLELNDIKIVDCSKNYETLSWPDPKNPKFINIVVKVKTFFSPKKLLLVCNKIENELGRFRIKKNEPRTCDIDIIDYNKEIIYVKGNKYLNIPHPEISKRNFVLLPLYDVSKSWRHPKTKISIDKLINLLKIDDLRGIKQI
jgi:2-amino-4-hydroxy-6-hydroxymethyldihydropteridine diphosphokinase